MGSIADIDQNFVKHIENLAALSKKAGDGIASYTQTNWYNPPNSEGLDLNNPNAATEKFDRQALNEKFEQVVKSGGTVGDQIVLKKQIDYIADFERAWRASKCSYIRARMMAAGRLQAHGDAAGVFRGFVLKETQDFVRNAKESPK